VHAPFDPVDGETWATSEGAESHAYGVRRRHPTWIVEVREVEAGTIEAAS
jgi:hypothetical protein